MRRSDYGKAHTTGRAAAGSRQVAIRLSAEEYARVCAASGERSVTGWCTDAVRSALAKPATTVVG